MLGAKTFMSQFGRPHGVLGWLLAPMIPMAHRQFYPKVARVLDLQTEDDLLDVACGSGDFLAEQAAHVRHVVGLDISGIEVRLARRRLRRRIAADTAEVVRGNAEDLPFDDGRFTALSCIGSFVAFPDPKAALAEMRRVLSPVGRAVVSFEMHAEDGKDHARQEAAWGMHFWTADEARTAFESAGFDRVEVTHDGELMLVRGVASRSVDDGPTGVGSTSASRDTGL